MISLSVSLLMMSRIWILGSLISSSFVIKCNCSIWFFLMMFLSLFIIDLMGLFFYNKIGSIRSIGDLPTTNIIEPRKAMIEKGRNLSFLFWLHNIHRGFTHYKYYRAFLFLKLGENHFDSLFFEFQANCVNCSGLKNFSNSFYIMIFN